VNTAVDYSTQRNKKNVEQYKFGPSDTTNATTPISFII